MSTEVPDEAVVADCLCTQEVSPIAASRYWCTRAWPAVGRRPIDPSQSWPTPHTHEPGIVVFTETPGAPPGADPVATAPTECAPLKAATVMLPS